ncbi:MAG: cation diffusion facilitator family transporter [candidate division WOR-3 bacterium]
MANKPSKNNVRRLKKITWIGLGSNILLSAFKFAVGIIGKSQAVVADAVHSLSDVGTDLAVLFGVKFWSSPADPEHPYGHWRIETLVTSIIGVVLFVTGIEIAYKAITTIEEVHKTGPSLIAISGPLISVILKEILYRWTRTVGREIKSKALVANAWHHRSDVFSSIPVLIAVFLAAIDPRFMIVDHIGACIVSIFIIKVSWDILKESFGELVDVSAPKKDIKRIKDVTMKVAGVKSIHAVRTRKLGPGLHVDLHVLVDGNVTVREGHDISEEVKKELLDTGPNIFDVVVHLEPYNN